VVSPDARKALRAMKRNTVFAAWTTAWATTNAGMATAALNPSPTAPVFACRRVCRTSTVLVGSCAALVMGCASPRTLRASRLETSANPTSSARQAAPVFGSETTRWESVLSPAAPPARCARLAADAIRSARVASSFVSRNVPLERVPAGCSVASSTRVPDAFPPVRRMTNVPLAISALKVSAWIPPRRTALFAERTADLSACRMEALSAVWTARVAAAKAPAAARS
jgi:hypothetical protein